MKRDHLLGFFQPSDLWEGESSYLRRQKASIPEKIKEGMKPFNSEEARLEDKRLTEALDGGKKKPVETPQEEKPKQFEYVKGLPPYEGWWLASIYTSSASGIKLLFRHGQWWPNGWNEETADRHHKFNEKSSIHQDWYFKSLP